MTEKPTPQDGSLMSIPDAARELNCSPITVCRLIRAKRLAVIRVSATLVRVSRAEIDKLIEEARWPFD